MKYLVFDTETTGLDNPRLVSLAAILTTEKDDLESLYTVVIPATDITPAAEAVHGISNDYAYENGVSRLVALSEFLAMWKQADIIVGHNISFDLEVISNEARDLGLVFPERPTLCTMRLTESFCAIPSPRGGYKYPRLSELHERLFGFEFDMAHDAMADTSACRRCLRELLSLGVIDGEDAYLRGERFGVGDPLTTNTPADLIETEVLEAC